MILGMLCLPDLSSELNTSRPNQIIHFLDNGFRSLATSQKVCDAWQKLFEVKGRLRSVRHWLTRASNLASPKKNWRQSFGTTSHLWRASKVVSAGSMWSSLSFWPARLGVQPLTSFRSSKRPLNPTIEFELISAVTAWHRFLQGVRFVAQARFIKPILNDPACGLGENFGVSNRTCRALV